MSRRADANVRILWASHGGKDMAGRSPALRLGLPGLTPHERMLLVTDGTFTYLLEAYLDRSIVVEISKHVEIEADAAIRAQFRNPKLARVIDREALLVESVSRRPCVYARTFIDGSAFDPAALAELAVSNRGIGRIVDDLAVPTAREFLALRVEENGEHLRFFGDPQNRQSLVRIYRILVEGRCAAVVTEKIPRALFADP